MNNIDSDSDSRGSEFSANLKLIDTVISEQERLKKQNSESFIVLLAKSKNMEYIDTKFLFEVRDFLTPYKSKFLSLAKDLEIPFNREDNYYYFTPRAIGFLVVFLKKLIKSIPENDIRKLNTSQSKKNLLDKINYTIKLLGSKTIFRKVFRKDKEIKVEVFYTNLESIVELYVAWLNSHSKK